MKGNSHESFEGHVSVQVSSERSFGWVVGGVLLLIALWPLLHGNGPRLWALIPALLLIGSAILRPEILRPLNKLWFRLGLLLGRVISPIVLGIVYYFWITPFAVVMRLFNKRFLALKFEPDAKSYWIIREPADPDPARMRRPY
ncbi:MAG: SxtJ family membrane protein [Xanthobacteraceae bacterium]